jgi:hypothetical protein
MPLLDQPSKKVPFTLLFVDEIDLSLYDKAIESSNHLADSYNPETQTSDFSIYAGTQLTYKQTWSWQGIFNSADDSKVDDH